MVAPMTIPVGSAASVVAGIVLALFAIIGGVSSVSAGPNPASATEELVRYDAR
jgi:hypothetical protein